MMTIVSWNCHYNFNVNSGFTLEKHQKIREYNPDILIIYECTKNDFDKVKREWDYRNWYCDDLVEDSNIGVAIFSKKYKIEFTEHFNRNFRYVIPYKITGYKYDIILFLVWAKEEPYYYKNIFLAVDSHEYDFLLNQNAIVIGDFNTGLVKDFHKEENDKQKKHNMVYKKLLEKLSILKNCTVGTEYEYGVTYSHNNNEFYLNDFCFVSERIKNDVTIEIPNESNYWEKIGNKKFWNGLSDHCPIIIELR
jgi:endonuclease/exonuclease/phosphatase family metal-dependent hydrolase